MESRKGERPRFRRETEDRWGRSQDHLVESHWSHVITLCVGRKTTLEFVLAALNAADKLEKESGL